jgi:hypothetical protein
VVWWADIVFYDLISKTNNITDIRLNPSMSVPISL